MVQAWGREPVAAGTGRESDEAWEEFALLKREL